MYTVFGGFSIIFLEDIAQLQTVLDRPIYCSVLEDPMAIMGFFAFRKTDLVMKLEQNVRVSIAADQQEFRELLLRLRNGESTTAAGKLLNTLSFQNFSSKQMANFKTRWAHTNDAVSACNYIMLLKIGTTIITVKANHNIKKESIMSPKELEA